MIKIKKGTFITKVIHLFKLYDQKGELQIIRFS